MAPISLPKSLNLFDAYSFFKELKRNFGTKFTLLIISNYLGIKGALNEFTGLVQLPYYIDGNWANNEYQTYMALSGIPWSIKGIGGILSDVFPIFGYSKSSYFIIYTFLGFIACTILGTIPMSKENTDGIYPMFCFFFMSLQGAFSDLLCQGKYAELMKRSRGNRGNIVSFSYFCIAIGTLIPTTLIGVVSTYFKTTYLFFIFLPLSFQPLIFILSGCMIEDKVTPDRNNKLDTNKIKSKPRPLAMAFLMFIFGIGSVGVGFTGDSLIILLYNLSAGIILVAVAFYCLPRIIAKCVSYTFTVQVLYINIDGSMEYFYTGSENCVPDGPQFSILYYRTFVGYAGIVAQIIGIWFFQAVMTNWNFRPIFWFSTLVRISASTIDIIMVNRWNLALGIPDQYMYIFGYAIIYKAAYYIDFMPTVLLCAKACPADIEVTVFAIVAGYSNYGLAVARYLGVYLTDSLGINLVMDGPCFYNNLTIAIIIGHLCTPLIGIPLTFLLIPPFKVSDNFADDAFNKFYSQKKLVLEVADCMNSTAKKVKPDRNPTLNIV